MNYLKRNTVSLNAYMTGLMRPYYMLLNPSPQKPRLYIFSLHWWKKLPICSYFKYIPVSPPLSACCDEVGDERKFMLGNFYKTLCTFFQSQRRVWESGIFVKNWDSGIRMLRFTSFPYHLPASGSWINFFNFPESQRPHL